MRARYLQGKTTAKMVVKPFVIATLHYVVATNCALVLQGYNANKARNITCYAVFNTLQQAYAYLQSNKMQLYASVVTL